MKKILIGMLALSTITNAMASTPIQSKINFKKIGLDNEQIYCSQAYQDKFKRMDKNHVWREVGNIAFAAGVVGGSLALFTIGLGAAGWYGATTAMPYSFGTLAALGEGFSGTSSFNPFDHEETLHRAYSALILSKVSVYQLRNELHGQTVSDIVSEQNEARENIGLDPLSPDEINKISLSTPDKEHARTVIDFLVDKLNYEKTDENYEKVRIEIEKLINDDTFCPLKSDKNKPVTLNQMKNILEQYL